MSNSTNVDTWAYEGADQQNTWYGSQNLINASNVGQLKLASSNTLYQISGTPVISRGIIYVSGGTFSPGFVYALNESNGATIWKSGPPIYNYSTTAGVTVDQTKNLLFAGTFENTLVALNATTGSLVWISNLDQAIDTGSYGSYIGPEAAPLVFHDEVIIGNIEGNVAGRGFLRAINETSGNPLWTFYVVPASPITPSTDQSFYNDTWGDCNYCGGGDLWSIPALNPNSGVIYFGTGDPSPSFNASERSPAPSATNLYTDCIIALNVTNGNLIWYYQTIPADNHNWDAAMPVQLFNTTLNGQLTQVVGAGSKDGYYYEINAGNGQLIFKKSLGIHLNDNEPPTASGSIVYPGSFGGVNTFSSFDPITNMVYTMTYNYPSDFVASPITLNGDGGAGNDVQGEQINSTLYAIDASTGSVAWSRAFQGLGGGASSTNDLVFTSDGFDNYYALDARNGSTLWTYNDGKGQFADGLANWGPPAVVDGMVFETSIANDGGVLAFVPSSNTSSGAPKQVFADFGFDQGLISFLMSFLFISVPIIRISYFRLTRAE